VDLNVSVILKATCYLRNAAICDYAFWSHVINTDVFVESSSWRLTTASCDKHLKQVGGTSVRGTDERICKLSTKITRKL